MEEKGKLMPSVFRDSKLQREFDDLGYVKFRALEEDVVHALREFYKSLNLVDELGAGYEVSLYSSDMEIRRRVREFLNSRAFPFLEPFLIDRWSYMSTYLVKKPKGTIIWAHQDWSHCDETKHHSMMCWIPLCDVDEDNAALGFVNRSHKYFDYLRGFPYQPAETPVNVHRLKIVPYLNILRMQAGEAVVFSNRTIHGSLSNYSTHDRLAVSFALHPSSEPLLSYYLKPGVKASILLKYQADPDFYLEYNNPRMWELYEQGRTIESHKVLEEVPYRLDGMDWDALEEKLTSSGNQRDPWKVAKTEEYYGIRL